MRYWETDVHRDVASIAAEIERVVARKARRSRKAAKEICKKMGHSRRTIEEDASAGCTGSEDDVRSLMVTRGMHGFEA